MSKAYEEVATPEFQQKLTEIRRLLEEAYTHYFQLSDGHCKGSEGQVSIHFPAFFWEDEAASRRAEIGIYSYVLSPSRGHLFNSVDDALADVREWHGYEMADDHSEPWP